MSNFVFANLLSMMIHFKAHFLDYPIKTLQIDNAQESWSRSFEDYYIPTKIDLTYVVLYKHVQNELEKSFIYWI